jgi:chemotaxis protein MotA
MDIATVVGLVLGIGALFATALLEGTHLSALVNIPAFVLIVGGSFGATIVSFALSDIMRIPKFLKEALFAPPLGLAERARQLVELAQKARREGLLALEEDARNIDDPFLQKGLQLVVDGTEPEIVRAVLESEIAVWEEREKVGEQIFTAIGGFCPTMGIMGAVLGLMHALGQSDDPKKMAKAIAVAFVATLYGVGFANLVFLPIAGKLKVRVAEKRLLYELTLEGILAIQAGENPRLVAEKLSAYLPPSERAKFAEQPVGAAA